MKELHRIGDHRRTLVERRLQRLEHVVVPALGHDAHRRGVGVEQVAQCGVVVDLATWPAGAPECHQRRRPKLQLRVGAGEELDVLWVRARPTTLDVGDTEMIQLLGDAQLVVDGGRHALHLEAVAQCGVEHFDVIRLGVHSSDLSQHRGESGNERAARRGGSKRTSAWGRGALANDDDRGLREHGHGCHSTGKTGSRQTSTCAQAVTERWMNKKVLWLTPNVCG
jgi:hypothetical protein